MQGAPWPSLVVIWQKSCRILEILNPPSQGKFISNTCGGVRAHTYTHFSRNIRSFAVSFEKTAASNAKHAQELNRTIIDGLRLIGIYCGTAEVEYLYYLCEIISYKFIHLIACPGKPLECNA